MNRSVAEDGDWLNDHLIYWRGKATGAALSEQGRAIAALRGRRQGGKELTEIVIWFRAS